MKGLVSTRKDQYIQTGVWKKGTYTFQAIVSSSCGYAFAFQYADLTWKVIDVSWQVQAGDYCEVQETFTLDQDAVALSIVANEVTGQVVVVRMMLEQGTNKSTPIAHEEDLRGMDGDNHEFIFTRNNTGIAPETPLSTQDDDLEPEGWTDNPQGVTKELPYEFVSMREKKNAVWLDFSPPSVWARYADDGISVQLYVQGHFKSHWENGSKIIEIAGGEIIDNVEYVKVTAKFRKGEADVTADALTSKGFIWYVNDIQYAVDAASILLDVTYADGNSDFVKLSYLVGTERETVQAEVIDVSDGADGADGADGINPVIYSLLPTVSNIKKDKNGNYDVTTISCKLLKNDGNVTTELSSNPTGYQLVFSLNGQPGDGNINPNTVIQTSEIASKIEFKFYKTGTTWQLLDSETVPVIIDGSDTITADLDNSMASYKTDANGTVTSGLPIVSTFVLSKGSTSLTLTTLSVTPISGVTVTANKDTGKVTVSAIDPLVADVINLQITGTSGAISKTLVLTINRIKDGAKGEDGNGIVSTVVQYAISTSGTVIPASGWTSTIPTPIQGRYLWTRTTINYKVPPSKVSYSVSYYATDGVSGSGSETRYRLGSTNPATPTGDNPSGWLLSAPSPTSSQMYAYMSTRTRPQGGAWTVWSPPEVYTRYVENGTTGKGVASVVNWYYKSSSISSLANGSWSTAKPDYSNSFYLWTKTITTYTDSSTSETPAILDPEWHKVQAITDKFGTTINNGLVTTVRVDLREANSTEVTAGFNGIQKTNVATYTEFEFGLSSLNSIPPSSWQETPPTRTAGYYLWMRFGTGAGDTKPTSWTNQLIEDGLNKYIELSSDRLSWHIMPFVTGNQYMRTVDAGVTSDIKKIINENVSDTLPAFWAGGRYEQAEAFNDFMQNFYNGTSTAANYDQLANIVMMHNGLSKMGDFIVDENGNVIIVDAATGKKRILFSATNLPDLATLLSTIDTGESVPNNAVENPSFNLLNDINVTVDGADITFKTDGTGLQNPYSLYAQYSSIDPPYVTIQSYLYLMKDGVYYDTIGFLEISNDSNSTKMTINRSWSNCPKGVYSVRGELEHYEPEPGLTITNIQHSIGTSTLSWSFVQTDVRRFQFGLNGFMAVYTLLHLYISETEGIDIKGKTNMPGILLSATVSLSGSFGNSWGAKKHLSKTAEKVSGLTGTYDIFHSIGHTNYQITANAYGNKTVSILSKSVDSCRVAIYNGTTLIDSQFDITLTGNNYA